MILAADELAILRAVVEAEERGEDGHTAALAAAQSMPKDTFLTILQRFNDARYLDVALNPGDGRLLGAHVRKALPGGVDVVRRETGVGEFLESSEYPLVERITHELHVIVQSGQIADRDAQADLDAQLQTIVAQVRSPRPRRRILAEAFKSARNILEGAIGGGAAAGALALIQQFLR